MSALKAKQLINTRWHLHISTFLLSLQSVAEHAQNILLSELKRFERLLFPHLSQSEDSSTTGDKEQDNSASEGALKITLHVLKKMGKKELANKLEKRKYQE